MIVNLTPHLIRIARGNDILELPSAGLARVTSTEIKVGEHDGIPLVKTKFSEVVGLPAPTPGTIFVVSAIVAAHANRDDVVSPDTGGTALRKDGQVWAVFNLKVGG
jgi:hypothetical protein